MNNLPKNSFSKAKQSMIENLQKNADLTTEEEINTDAENEIDSARDVAQTGADEGAPSPTEPPSEKAAEKEPKQKPAAKNKFVAREPEKPRTMPTAKKTLALPMIYEFAVKELKARRNFAKQLRGEKGMETEEDIFVEIFRLFFSQPGESADCLRVAQERMDLLTKEPNY